MSQHNNKLFIPCLVISQQQKKRKWTEVWESEVFWTDLLSSACEGRFAHVQLLLHCYPQPTRGVSYHQYVLLKTSVEIVCGNLYVNVCQASLAVRFLSHKIEKGKESRLSAIAKLKCRSRQMIQHCQMPASDFQPDSDHAWRGVVVH